MSADVNTDREHDGARAVYRMTGTFDRASAWALRERIETDPASQVVLDFSLTRDISDLAVAVLAHGFTASTRPVSFRGLRQHQLRILRYCGHAVDERADGPLVDVPGAPVEDPRSSPEVR